ncbi:alpha/beta-hydrolase [Wilcoxina mikolae CBS 423.85]|nr:alpha/beta-hydrolase [Wilcoxina mikolae CBS 423.85]
MLGLCFFLVSLLPTALAVPLTLGITLGPGSNDLPTLTLPYATYKAYSYDVTGDYYTFKNIRFAAPPTGQRRWAKPEPPLNEPGVQDGSVGYQCMQAPQALLIVTYPILANLEPMSEDCMFMDVVVPGKAARGDDKDLPVMVWFFGGGYIFGSKDFFLYNGGPLIKSANNSMIYIASNYRLGGYGFLNGPTVESQGTPNAGLHDQRAVLKWIQDYISLVGGNKLAVTVMGESAGAGSILHHLIGNGGTLDPMFQRAILQSPAFEPMYNATLLASQYTSFETAAGCAKGSGLACLRNRTTEELQTANLKIVNSAPYGTFGFGPGVDNTFIRDLPGVELAKGNYWKNVTVFFGHTNHEGMIFADPSELSESQVDELFATNFPAMTASNLQVLNQLYPKPPSLQSVLPILSPLLPSLPPSLPNPENFIRVSDVIGDWVINCNTRYLAKAYAGRAYGYRFSVPPGLHGSDVPYTFYSTDFNFLNIFQVDVPGIDTLTRKNVATALQSYLTSFVRTGNPNTYREFDNLIPHTVDVPPATVAQFVKVVDINVLKFQVVDDNPESRRDRCDFWQSAVWAGR